MGNDPKDCVILYWADADFAGSLKDSKSTSGGYLMLVGPQTFVPLAWCKKQGAVSHSTTEAETISLDAGLRLEALPQLILWDIVIDVFTTTKDKEQLRIRNAGSTVSGNGRLAIQCREAIVFSGSVSADPKTRTSCSVSAVPNTICKCLNDVLPFSLENMNWGW